MVKELKLLSPEVWDRCFIRNDGKCNKEKYRVLHVPGDYTNEELENDINAGAAHFKPCMDYINGEQSNMIVILCDTEEEGLNAVTYLAAAAGMEYTDSEAGDEDYEDCCDFEYENNIPIIGIEDLVRYELGDSSQYGNNQFMFNVNMDQQKHDPYWTEYNGDVCVIDKCLCDDDGNMALIDHDSAVSNPFDLGAEKDRWHRVFKRFTDEGNRVYYILVRNSGIKDLFSEKKEDDEEKDVIFGLYKQSYDQDFSLSSLIVKYTAELINLTANPAVKEEYYINLFRNYMKIYSYTLEKRFPVRKLLRNICFMDDKPSESMDKILKYVRHKHPDEKVLTKEVFFETGVLKNVLEKAEEKKKENSVYPKLDELVGMEDVKAQFENIIKTIKFSNERKKRGLPVLDYRNIFLLIGAPGTAKTTMANILGRRMKEEKLLADTRFGSFSGAQLKGQFVGQTAPKVHQIFEDHDIILIDEAYSLTASDVVGMDTYSQEALAQLAIELENHGKDRLIFFAGYGGSDVVEKNNKMKDFLDANPGIKSRINGTIVFPSYNEVQMIDIIKGIASRYGFMFEEGALTPVLKYFADRVNDENFGNGREARSFVDNCQMALAERVMKCPANKQTKKMMQLITKEDVRKTIDRLMEANSNQYGQKVRYGFI